MPSTNLSFRTPKPLMDQIQGRDLKGVKNPGATAKRDVERWYDVLADTLREVRLKPVEAVVLIHYASTYEGYPSHANVIDSWRVIHDQHLGLDAFFDGPAEDLVVKMQNWSVAEVYAAWDAAERYAVLTLRPTDPPMTFGMALHTVGLHTYDLSVKELAHIERMEAAPADSLPGLFMRTADVEVPDE